MKNILDYRIVIFDKESQVFDYPIVPGLMHQDCLDDFATKKGYLYSGCDYLVRNGNGVFYNMGSQMVLGYLPGILNDKQLYLLDYMENWLSDVKYMEVCKKIDKDQQVFCLGGDVADKFSKEVIQSYYNNVKKR